MAAQKFYSQIKEANLQIQFLLKYPLTSKMDGKGRALDNIYIERFWRTFKYENIYLNPANGCVELYEGVRKYITFYNEERRHSSIGNLTPNKCFEQMKSVS